MMESSLSVSDSAIKTIILCFEVIYSKTYMTFEKKRINTRKYPRIIDCINFDA